MLKSVDRINNLIDEGNIKIIYIFDGWNGCFTRKIGELFGDRVDVLVIANRFEVIGNTIFKEGDCLLLFEDVIHNLTLAAAHVIEKAKEDNAFVKLLTEDIFTSENDKRVKFNRAEINGKSLVKYAGKNFNSPIEEVNIYQFLEVVGSVLDVIEESERWLA